MSNLSEPHLQADFSGVVDPSDPELTSLVTATGLRSRKASTLKAALEGSLWSYEITRVADITDFDYLGIPVHMALKPQGKTLSSGSGKGETREASWISAVMEACEQTVWENLTPSPIEASERALDELGHRHVSGRILPRVKRSIWNDRMPVQWRLGWDISSGESVYVPDGMVVTGSPGLNPFVSGSNGLASGAHVLEAVLSGLLEVVERDGIMLNTVATRQPMFSPIEMLRLASPSMADAFERTRLPLAVRDATTEVGIPTIVAYLGDELGGRTGAFKGAGAATSTHAALVRAVSEAAQARCLIVAGARDDHFASQRRSGIRQPAAGAYEVPEPFVGNIDLGTGSIAGDIDLIVGRLRASGFDQVIVVRHTEPEELVQVVRVIVPGLEGYKFAHADLGDRARAYAGIERGTS